MILLYLLETYLALRQHAALKLPMLPVVLQGIIRPEKFKKSRSYMIKQSYLHVVRETATVLVDCMILLHRILPWLWKMSGSFLGYIGLNAENEILHTLSFLMVVMIWSQIFELPFSLYSTFMIEARHDYNGQTLSQFFKDLFIGLGICSLFGAPVAAAIILIIQRGGCCLVIYLWAFSFLASVALTTVYPLLIAPLFNKFTPLPNGELRTKVENLAHSLNFPLKDIFLADGSRRSTHSNAYMYGFFKKNIVLDDTLTKQCKDTGEVVAIIAHEMGHWKLHHTIYAFFRLQVLALLQFGVFDLVRKSSYMFQTFGFDTQPIIIGFFIFQHVVMPAQRLLSFGMNLLSRYSEFEADAFAKNLGHGTALRAALVNLQEQNLSAVNTDPWYSAYHYPHPPLAERLAALNEMDKKLA
ncbi:CAAX prenyl protease 1 homolog isoform X2 [Malania oleifera]|nr:CAAX prenyl protease 1 homolog isoform X2 [Malania oleifera]